MKTIITIAFILSAVGLSACNDTSSAGGGGVAASSPGVPKVADPAPNSNAQIVGSLNP